MNTPTSRVLEIPQGQTDTQAIKIPPSVYVNTIFVPASVDGTSLTFFGDMGDDVLRQLNFSFDLTSEEPPFKGQIVSDMAVKLGGLVRIQMKTDAPQTQDLPITIGFVF